MFGFGKQEKNEGASERVQEVQIIVRGLMDMVNADKLIEVESVQPENLHQYEVKDEKGNEITYIRNNEGNLAHPIEVRDSNGKLIAQSWDGEGWSVDKYIETGVDFSI